MKEQIAQLEEATVRAYIKKDLPLNSMATFGGGWISALSALVLDNSDFFTGSVTKKVMSMLSN